MPERYLAAWQAMLAQCPPGAKPIVWEAAIYDAATLLGDFGTLLVEYGWTAGDLFDVPYEGRPGGLAWFLKGETVRSLGPEHAVTTNDRVFDRVTRSDWRNPYRREAESRVVFNGK